MSERFSDDDVEKILSQMTELFDRLKLTGEERAFAIQAGDAAYESVVNAHLSIPDESYDRIRAVAASAALAYALIKLDVWAGKLDEDFPKS
jgi:hypothetical protein